MTFSTTKIVTIFYTSLNVAITTLVSIVGVKLARFQFVATNEASNHNGIMVGVNPKTIIGHQENLENEEKSQTVNESLEKAGDNRTDEVKLELKFSDNLRHLASLSFFKLWAKLSWKMRSVYMSLFVHAFDVLTDILVIISWWDYEKDENVENINARLMAICAIIVLAFHKIVSTAAFWIKEQNFNRCLLQFFDFLIFEEIYISHKQIVSQFKGTKSSEAEAVDTSTSFKYIRSLEAVFESIPQSVLQMVFIIRTGGLAYNPEKFDLFIVSYLSIFQSIVSMTNSIIKNDNLYMNAPKFKKHKQRLPPTLPFLKHMICRLSEVFYRIVLLSLFWSVCGGRAFGILLGVELFIIVLLTAIEYKVDGFGVSIMTFDEMLLRFQALVILPSEMVFAASAYGGGGNVQDLQPYIDCGRGAYNIEGGVLGVASGICSTLCCCYFPAILLSTGCRFRDDHFIHPTFRIGISLSEWTIIILFHFYNVYQAENFLLREDRGRFLFIIGIVCFLIYSQYLSLLPDFKLPLGVSIRSKFGYAFNGELEELKRLKLYKKCISSIALFGVTPGTNTSSAIKKVLIGYGLTPSQLKGAKDYVQLEWPETTLLKEKEDELMQRIRNCTSEDLGFDDTKVFFDDPIDEEPVHDAYDPIDEGPVRNVTIMPMAAFAHANQHRDIVHWLENEMGATRHIKMYDDYRKWTDSGLSEEQYFKKVIDPKNEYFN